MTTPTWDSSNHKNCKNFNTILSFRTCLSNVNDQDTGEIKAVQPNSVARPPEVVTVSHDCIRTLGRLLLYGAGGGFLGRGAEVPSWLWMTAPCTPACGIRCGRTCLLFPHLHIDSVCSSLSHFAASAAPWGGLPETKGYRAGSKPERSRPCNRKSKEDRGEASVSGPSPPPRPQTGP